MRFPLLTVPVAQNWDCQATGTCCKEYRIHLSDDERRRIEGQGWDVDRDLGGDAPIRRRGWFRPRYYLNRRPDRGCVFLSDDGRCRIHERFGFDAKPLACRLFPFVLVPVADSWRVGLRFACPSAAASVGREIADHGAGLEVLGQQLASREVLQLQPGGYWTRPPRLDARQDPGWPTLLAIADLFLGFIRDRRDPIELRWRKCLALAELLRQARLDQFPEAGRARTLSLLAVTAATAPRDPRQVPAPTPLGRVVFRLIASLYTRKDHGPNRGLATGGRWSLLRAVGCFARGSGAVPRMHRLLPESTFEQAEEPAAPLDSAAEEVLERYWTVKIASFQFCGAHSFGLPFRAGLEALAVTVPLVLWVMRLFRDVPRSEAAIRAVTIVDDHFGYNPLLGSRRMRLAFEVLARRDELARLIAWYGRPADGLDVTQ